MSERNHTLAYALGHINADYIAEAEIPALTAAAACPCRGEKERNTPRFWESGWFAAAVSGIVAVGVLAAIIMAGQRNPRPPVGTEDTRPPVTETQPTETEPPTETVESPHTVPEGFVVTDRRYDYRGDTVILLHVTNETSENVLLTVRLYTEDGNGNKHLLDRQRIVGFPADYEKYLMLRTDKEVTAYSYTVTAEPYDGECLDSLYRSEFHSLSEDVSLIPPNEYGDPDYDAWDTDWSSPGLLLRMTHAYLGNQPASVTQTCILFDNQGNIFYITEPENQYYSKYQDGGIQCIFVYISAEDTLTWPEELLGDGVTAIRIFSVTYTNMTFPDLP